MKIKVVLLLSLVCLITFFIPSERRSLAQSRMTIDPDFIPVAIQTLPQQLLADSNNLAGLELLISRSVYQGHGKDTYEDMATLVKQHPDNMNFLQGMYMLDSIANHEYVLDLFLKIPNIRASSSYQGGTMLGTILSKDSNPWLALDVLGAREIFIDKNYEEGLNNLKKAELGEPNVAYTHLALTFAYGLYSTPLSSDQKFEMEAMKAFEINNHSSCAAIYVFDYYEFKLKDSVQAAKWSKIVLSLIPDEPVLPRYLRKSLDDAQKAGEN